MGLRDVPSVFGDSRFADNPQGYDSDICNGFVEIKHTVLKNRGKKQKCQILGSHFSHSQKVSTPYGPNSPPKEEIEKGKKTHQRCPY